MPTKNVEKAIRSLTEAIIQSTEESVDVDELFELRQYISDAFEKNLKTVDFRTHNVAEGDLGDLVSFSTVVSARIRRLRESAGWSQPQLADGMRELAFDWKRTTVSDAESGRRSVTIDELFGLSVLFSLPVASMLLPTTTEVIECPEKKRDDLHQPLTAEQQQELDRTGTVTTELICIGPLHLTPEKVVELLVGNGGKVGTGGQAWKLPRSLAYGFPDDWRPVADMVEA